MMQWLLLDTKRCVSTRHNSEGDLKREELKQYVVAKRLCYSAKQEYTAARHVHE